MTELNQEIIKAFGNRIRTRVSGICIDDQKILLIKHHTLGPEGILWAPPGGGMEFGESAEQCLIREFLEETGLTIKVEKFLFVHEFLDPPLHAVELFFEVKVVSGELLTGSDPEIKLEHQIIHDVQYFTDDEIKSQNGNIFHNVISLSGNIRELLLMKGYFIYEKSTNKSRNS
jgi:8-oxo-dGTP diphosphatase